VSKRRWIPFTFLSCLMVCVALAAGEDTQKQRLDRQYQSAVADYEAQHYSAAAEQLEKLLPYAPESFEIHELLGLTYASLLQNGKAADHLKKAVQIKPNSAEARTNFGTSLLRSGSVELAGEQFRKALALEPQNFDTNHNLGEYYVRTGKLADARPLLEAAQKINPDSYDNGYDLAMTNFVLGRFSEARTVVQELLKRKNTGELHSLLGQIEEKDGKFVAAANEFEIAAHMDPSEDNLFAWGSEMLLHRTYEPAIAIFQEGAKRYPNSPRILIGLGLSLYSRGKYDEAVKALLAAADLNPSDARCYLFLSKAYNSSPLQADGVTERFRRYAELQPRNGRAQYYYAISLWKGKRAGDLSLDLQTVQALLKKAISLDDSLSEAYLQLGNLLADQHKYEESIPEYVRALETGPDSCGCSLSPWNELRTRRRKREGAKGVCDLPEASR
jgi:tetratricopeptide (TPR) repeat protein